MRMSRSWKDVVEGRDGELQRGEGEGNLYNTSVTFVFVVCYQASPTFWSMLPNLHGLWRITCEIPDSMYFNENAPLLRTGSGLKFWLLLSMGETLFYFIFLPTFCVTRRINAVCTR